MKWGDEGPRGCSLALLVPLLLFALLWLTEPPPEVPDDQGDDCPDHGPYDGEDCDKC